MSLDIYETDKRLSALIKRIERSDEICEENKKEIFSFYSNCLASGLSRQRVLKLLNHLYRIALMLGTTFVASTKQDAIKVVQEIESKNLSPQTKREREKN